MRWRSFVFEEPRSQPQANFAWSATPGRMSAPAPAWYISRNPRVTCSRPAIVVGLGLPRAVAGRENQSALRAPTLAGLCVPDAALVGAAGTLLSAGSSSLWMAATSRPVLVP